jgi:hypothetical protein
LPKQPGAPKHPERPGQTFRNVQSVSLHIHLSHISRNVLDIGSGNLRISANLHYIAKQFNTS